MENYLKNIHADQYTGTDDNMSDDFESWLEDLDTEELLIHADNWMSEHLERVKLLSL